jgi:hypothetical protein
VFLIGSMAAKAIVREDRPDLPVEVNGRDSRAPDPQAGTCGQRE